MKYRLLNIIIFLCPFWSGYAFSQNCITDPPKPPVLTSVSVDPETGNTNLTWTSSPSSDIAAYILYTYKNRDGMPVDTVWDSTATSYTLSSTASKYFSVSYVIAAMRLPRCTSILSDSINSIFETASLDTCNKKIMILWNRYPSFPQKVTGYTVLLSEGGGTFYEAGNVNAGDTSYVLNDFTINTEYCFVVRANLEGGKFSTSNKTCLSTKMQRPPLWINADQATLNSEGKITLSFTVDPMSEIKHFSLERKTGSSGTFQEISRPVSVNGSVYYTDNQANTNIINYYRLSAVNGCNIPVMVSNLASNIVLSLKRSGNNIILSWNPYQSWLGTISSYKLFVNSGKGYEEQNVIPASDTVFVQDYQQIMYKVSGNEVCFYIDASEASNPYGISGASISSTICTSPIEIITIPNVFTPNNDLDNDLFRPVLSFTPSDYQLIISDRQGNILFETRDYLESWDGSKNGKPQPQGVFLWFLKLTTPSGKTISKTGTITIIRDR
ncbi:MAG: gliding motility-associated C-terminal domain-containing protein [Bacteroidales bacterium]